MDMQFNSKRIHFLAFVVFFLSATIVVGQVNTVEFGKSRMQYGKKKKWKFYQSPNFNVYVTNNGSELGKFVTILAERELASIEDFVEYALQRRANIVIYNDYNEYKATNIGLGLDWNNAGGLTKLVNNKIPVYFDGNHANLRLQVRQGIAKVLVDNLLFGDDIGEIASNQALLDLPKWLVDGYIAYAANEWDTDKDDQLRSALLSGNYNTFYQFAFDQPLLAGQAFWKYIADNYKKENVTYFLYLARIYKNLNSASLKICKKKFKEVLSDFMRVEGEKYLKDLRQRRNQPRGNLVVAQDISSKDYYNFSVNPNPRNNTYAAVEFKNGIYKLQLNENFYEFKTLLKLGARTRQGDISPNYPITAWDGKGTRLFVAYWEEGKIKMFVYDLIAKLKRNKQEIEGLDQIVSASYMLDNNTVIFSAVKNGQTDIFIYKIEQNKLEQVTNDVYDDLDPTFVSFPNRSGIIYSSNRPSATAISADTILPSNNKFNVFLVDIENKGAYKQITQLTNMKFGNARSPMAYNVNHFTFTSDESGIGNRWAGFFSTQRDGLDTLFYIGEEVLRNPTPRDLDSTLMAWRKDEPDSISYFQVFKDSTYTFPITNYQSSMLESKIAGDNGQVSEVRREGDYKFVYKLKVDSALLRKRNVTARPTDFMKQLMANAKVQSGAATVYKKSADSSKSNKKVFETEFDDDINNVVVKPDDNATAESPLAKVKYYNYRLKFSADYVLSGLTNNILVNRYQPYGGGQGPIQLNNGNDLNWTFRVGVVDLLEDIKFVGGIRFGGNLRDKDMVMSFLNYRRRVDWGATYFRSYVNNYFGYFTGANAFYNSSLITNLYQGWVSYPLNEVKSIRITLGARTDRGILKSFNNGIGAPDRNGLKTPDSVSTYGLGRVEYVHDNTINPTQNIWNGLRYKIYMDFNMPTSANEVNNGKGTFNFGFDARYYHKIYRNFIWAARAAGDFSWGNQKLIYYLGGVDGWVNPRFNSLNRPAADQSYAFQSLAVNMRGFNQNVANGNNALVINSEFRLPVFTTFFNKPINNAFIRNFQLVQFMDLGTAWNGKFNTLGSRPGVVYPGGNNNPIIVRIKAGGIGPFVGGYGFGARTTFLGYFVKYDVAWEMNGLFKGKPLAYLALGLDF